MNEDEAYLEIAKRFISSCEEHLNNGINIQEVLGFNSYHAFESIAGAFNSHYGNRVPLSHTRKLNSFVYNARVNNQVNGIAIATIAMTLNSMRNKYLYPEPQGTNFKTPKEQVSLSNVRDMIRKINGIIRQVERLI